MSNVSGYRPELQFIKYLLANAPELEKMNIMYGISEIDMEFVKTLVELTGFRRASQKAEIKFPRLNLDQP